MQSIQQVYDWTHIPGGSYPRYNLLAVVSGQPSLPYHLVVPLLVPVAVPPWGMPEIATGWADDT
jgi:hypothetical protein